MENIEKVEFTPLNISDEELADIPDCQFYVCEYDVLKNDGQIMHARLQKLKKNSQITTIEGLFNIFRVKHNYVQLFRWFSWPNDVRQTVLGAENFFKNYENIRRLS